MENKTKLQTFVGFTVRARKCRIGMNAALTLKRASLILVCKSASENTKKDALKAAKRLGCAAWVTTEITLEDMVFKPNAKVMAITDVKLAKAILDNKSTEITELV